MILVAGTVSVLEIERSGLQRPTRIPLEFTCHSTRAGTLSILITSVNSEPRRMSALKQYYSVN